MTSHYGPKINGLYGNLIYIVLTSHMQPTARTYAKEHWKSRRILSKYTVSQTSTDSLSLRYM